VVTKGNYVVVDVCKDENVDVDYGGGGGGICCW
jgi:hypothetical protein